MERKTCLSVILIVVLVSMATAAPTAAPAEKAASDEKSIMPGRMVMADSYNKFMPELEQKYFETYVKNNGMMADKKSGEGDSSSSSSKSSGGASGSVTGYTQILPKVLQKFMKMYAGNIKKMLKI